MVKNAIRYVTWSLKIKNFMKFILHLQKYWIFVLYKFYFNNFFLFLHFCDIYKPRLCLLIIFPYLLKLDFKFLNFHLQNFVYQLSLSKFLHKSYPIIQDVTQWTLYGYVSVSYVHVFVIIGNFGFWFFCLHYFPNSTLFCNVLYVRNDVEPNINVSKDHR